MNIHNKIYVSLCKMLLPNEFFIPQLLKTDKQKENFCFQRFLHFGIENKVLNTYT